MVIKRKGMITALFVVMALAAAACGGDTEEAATTTAGDEGAATTADEAATTTAGGEATTTAAEMAAPEVTDLTIGVLPIIDVATVYVALDQGLFEAEGFSSVTIETLAGGAAAIPALVSGELDVAFGAWPSFLTANQEGLALQAIADGVQAVPDFTLFLAAAGSDLEGNPASMQGTTVAVNTLGNLGELAVRSTLRDAGADPNDVELVEVGFGDMGAALELGDVDVIWVVEPLATINQNAGAVVVADSYGGSMEGFPVAGYQVTGDFAVENPNTVAAVQRALYAATDLINADPQIVVDLSGEWTTLTPELAAEITLPAFVGPIEATTLQTVNDFMVDFGILDEGLDVNSLIVGG